jgi:integrase
MVRTTKRRGKRILVLDFSYTKPDGSTGRYRRDAEVQTRSGALAEERRRLAAVAAKGSPHALVDETAARVEAEQVPPRPAGPKLGEIVEDFCNVYGASRFKAGTRVTYRHALDKHILPHLGSTPLGAIQAGTVRKLDAALMTGGLNRAHRRLIQTVLRSVVCKYAVEAGHLTEPPRMPKLPGKSDKIPIVISTEQATRIIDAARRPEHRLALLLAFHAGLRSCEIRGLRVCDIDLDGGALCVRQAICFGVVDTPKSGHDREVPLTKALRGALAQAVPSKTRNALVALTARGRPWGQGGLRAMFMRAAERAGIVGSTMHHMRHGFVTALLDEGVGAHVVKELAGHADLTTTERYAHALAERKRAAIGVFDRLGTQKQ